MHSQLDKVAIVMRQEINQYQSMSLRMGKFPSQRYYQNPFSEPLSARSSSSSEGKPRLLLPERAGATMWCLRDTEFSNNILELNELGDVQFRLTAPINLRHPPLLLPSLHVPSCEQAPPPDTQAWWEACLCPRHPRPLRQSRHLQTSSRR